MSERKAFIEGYKAGMCKKAEMEITYDLRNGYYLSVSEFAEPTYCWQIFDSNDIGREHGIKMTSLGAYEAGIECFNSKY